MAVRYNFVEYAGLRTTKGDNSRVRLNKGGGISIPRSVYTRLGSPKFLKVEYEMVHKWLRLTPQTEPGRRVFYSSPTSKAKINTNLTNYLPVGFYHLKPTNDKIKEGRVFCYQS